MNPKLFLAAAILGIAILVPLGAPLPALVVGIALAGILAATLYRSNEPSTGKMKKKSPR